MAISEETRIIIFNKLKKNLEKFIPPLVMTNNSSNGSYEIIGNTPVPYGYSKKIVAGMFFASLAHRKDSVTLHFFPMYMDASLTEMAPSLNKCLKGKTCFHFTKEEQLNEQELMLLLESGLKKWEKLGYIK